MAKKSHSDYDEIQHIKDDLTSLKTNVITLTQHLSDEGRGRLSDARGQMRELVKAIRADGSRRYKHMEKQVQDHPAQAVMLAFAGGVLASALLKRR